MSRLRQSGSNAGNKPTLQGKNIYIDNKNRFIFHHKKSNVGYVIPDADLGRFNMMQSRFILGICVGVVADYFIKAELIYSILIGAVAYLFAEYYFRYKMLPSYIIIDKFQKEKYTNSLDIKRTQSKRRAIIMTIIYIIFGIAVIASVFVVKKEKPDLLADALMVFLGCASFYYAYRSYTSIE